MKWQIKLEWTDTSLALIHVVCCRIYYIPSELKSIVRVKTIMMWLTIIFHNSDFHIGIVLRVAYWAIENESTSLINRDGELDCAIQGYVIACNIHYQILYTKMKKNNGKKTRASFNATEGNVYFYFSKIVYVLILQLYPTCIVVPGGKTTWSPTKLMYMLGVTVKVTVTSRLLVAERYRGMDMLFSAFSSRKVNLVLKNPRRAEN